MHFLHVLLNVFIWGFMAVPAGQEDPKMGFCVCVHIPGRTVYLCTILIFSESSTFAGYDGTQYKCELGLFRGLWTTKRLPIKVSEQSAANLASTGITAEPQQAQVESYGKSSPESIGKEWLRYWQFRGCKWKNTGKAYQRN